MIRMYRFIRFVITFAIICSMIGVVCAVINSKSILTAFTAKTIIGDVVIGSIIGYFLYLRRGKRRKVSAQ